MHFQIQIWNLEPQGFMAHAQFYLCGTLQGQSGGLICPQVPCKAWEGGRHGSLQSPVPNPVPCHGLCGSLLSPVPGPVPSPVPCQGQHDSLQPLFQRLVLSLIPHQVHQGDLNHRSLSGGWRGSLQYSGDSRTEYCPGTNWSASSTEPLFQALFQTLICSLPSQGPYQG